MATNWNTILNNTNNLNDVLTILKKVLASLDIKVDVTTINEALATINGLDIDVQDKLKQVAEVIEGGTTRFEDIINELAAAGAGENGWIDSLVMTEEGFNQREKNRKTVDTVEFVADLASLVAWEGRVVYVKSIDSSYAYDSSNVSAISINGWVLKYDKSINITQLNYQNDDDISSLVEFAKLNKIQIEIPKNITVVSNQFVQDMFFGEGLVKYLYDYLANDNTEHVCHKILAPYNQKEKNNYGWYDVVTARSNWEQGAGYGLIVNDGTRPQVCGFRTKQQQKNYERVDIVGSYLHVCAPKSVKLENCTFTTNSVSSPTISASLDIKVGDFIVTDFDVNIGMPWRSQVTAIDFVNKKMAVTWWLHEQGNGEGVPPNGLACFTPYSNGVWGHNTNVFLKNSDKATVIIGYELGVSTEKPRNQFFSIDGFLAVNLTSQVARAQDAFKTSGNWDNGLGAYNCTNAVYTNGTTRYGIRHKNQLNDNNSSAVLLDISENQSGFLAKSIAGSESRFSINAVGAMSHIRYEFSIVSVSRTINGLSGSVFIGAAATANHTTTLQTTRMTAGQILRFKQTQDVNWTIVATNTYTLNTNGSIDYLELMFDGTNFIKILALKSL